ncbi:UMP-CMP kinase 2, mitochondrial [Lepisosteus oculatus]|uniref:UMP-CMP kinase 2, mitochondrial n=1 Tax=Lepisosteus oculatus TaxID=7918 RepID=UPI0035F5194D
MIPIRRVVRFLKTPFQYQACLLTMARPLTLCHLNRWCLRKFAVELGGGTYPVYFALNANPSVKDYEDDLAFQKLFDCAKGYSVHVSTGDRIQRARLHCDLQNTLVSRLPKTCNVLDLVDFQPDVKNSVIKGFFIQDSKDSQQTDRVLQELFQRHPFNLCTYVREEDDKLWWQYVWSQTDHGEMTVVKKNCVVPTETPVTHPSETNIINNVVFYSFEEAYNVLKECIKIIPESKQVLEAAEQCLSSEKRGTFPVIIVEGLDATGKTTLTQSLSQALEGSLLKSPPECLSPWRVRFDAEPPLIRRAFYALGNYITAGQIATQSAHSPVIVDRYWHSTAAYAIATEVSGKAENLPALSSDVYRWPSDLLKPDLVVLLTVSPAERQRRLQARGGNKTKEEAELEANQLFRQKVEEAFKRIEDPACAVIDAGPAREEVLKEVLLLINNKCHL